MGQRVSLVFFRLINHLLRSHAVCSLGNINPVIFCDIDVWTRNADYSDYGEGPQMEESLCLTDIVLPQCVAEDPL